MLCEAGLDIRVINPLLSSKHAKISIRKTKTDRVDARVLAVMVLTEPDLPPPLKLSRSQCAVRHTLGLIHSQEKHLQGMNRALANYRERMGQLGLATGKAHRQTVKAMEKLEQCHEKLLTELESYLFEARPEQQEVIERVSHVPDITRRNAALFTYVLNPQGRRYYDSLKAKGRKHKEALVIIARKLLSIIYNLVIYGKTFDHEKAFQIVA